MSVLLLVFPQKKPRETKVTTFKELVKAVNAVRSTAHSRAHEEASERRRQAPRLRSEDICRSFHRFHSSGFLHCECELFCNWVCYILFLKKSKLELYPEDSEELVEDLVQIIEIMKTLNSLLFFFFCLSFFHFIL